MTYVVLIALLASLHAVQVLAQTIAYRRLFPRAGRVTVGFGPIWLRSRREKGGYQLAALPTCVRPLSAEGEATPADRPIRFLACVLAGPAALWLLAVAGYTVSFSRTQTPDESTVIGTVLDGSPACEAGLRQGDRIVRIGELPVSTFEDVRRAIQLSGELPMDFFVLRGERTIELRFAAKDGRIGVKGTRSRMGVRSALYVATVLASTAPLHWIRHLQTEPEGQTSLFTNGAIAAEAFEEESSFVLAVNLWSLALGGWALLLAYLFLLPIPPFAGWSAVRTVGTLLSSYRRRKQTPGPH